jgi:hypothetical protein
VIEFDVEIFSEEGGWGYQLSQPHTDGAISPWRVWRRDWRPWWTRQDAMSASKKAAHSIKTTNAAHEAAKALRR